MENVILKVEGMSCNHCANSIERALNTVGANGKVDLGSHTVTIDYDGSKLTIEKLREAIEEQGYEVV